MFKFKNISSSEMGVICEEEKNLISRASHRFEEIVVEGRNGSIINDLGYSNKEKTMNLFITKPDKINDILSWLNGSGIFEYDNKYTTALFLDVAEPIRTASIKTLEIPFKMNPFWYKLNDDYIEATDSIIINEGNTDSAPLIKIYKNTSDEIDISINGIILHYTFNDNEDYVELDCLNYSVTYDGLNRFRNLEMGFQFPYLNPGENIVVINSGDPTILFKRKDCWL